MICNIIIASWGAMSSTGTLYNGNNTDGLELSYYTVGFQWIYALLVIKIYFVHFFTLLARNSTGQHASPEDRTPTVVQEKENSSVVERYLNLSRNDSENILPFFIASLLWQEYLSDIASDTFQLTGVILGGIFCACRFGHTIAYICGIQPWRSIFFFLGVIVTIVLLVANIIYISLLDNFESYSLKIAVLVCWTFLVLKLYFLAFYTGYSRYKQSIPVAPEDGQYLNKESDDVDIEEKSKSMVERILNCHYEELQLLLQLCICTPLIGTCQLYKIDSVAISAFFFGITFFRIIHTFFYLLTVKKYRKNCCRSVIFSFSHFLMLILLYWLTVRQIMTAFAL